MALQLLTRMDEREMAPGVITFSAAISACGNTETVLSALSFLVLISVL